MEPLTEIREKCITYEGAFKSQEKETESLERVANSPLNCYFKYREEQNAAA